MPRLCAAGAPTSTPIQLVLDRLSTRGYGPKASGPSQHKSRCPAHKGASNNLSIREGEDGTVLLRCHRVGETGQACAAADIVAELGLTLKDLFPATLGTSKLPPKKAAAPPPNGKPKPAPPARVFKTAEAAFKSIATRLGKLTATWLYFDEVGVEVAAVARFDPPEGKEFRPAHYDQTKGLWLIGDPPGLWPLFQLGEISGSNHVCAYIVEGEKCAVLAAEEIGLFAVTTAHGAQSPHKTDLSPLAGKEVTILPDVGPAGEGYARRLVELLAKLEPRPIVRIVRLPGLTNDGDDIEQWLALNEKLSYAARYNRITDLRDAAPLVDLDVGFVSFVSPPPQAHPENSGPPAVSSVSFVSDSPHTLPDFSSPPQPIVTVLRELPEFASDLLPDPLRIWALDIADRAQCSLEFVAVGMAASLAAVVGRKVGIRPKQHDFWTVVPNLWAMAVGRPGVLKTHAIEEATAPLKRRVGAATEAHALAVADHERQKLVMDAKRDAAKDELKRAAKKPGIADSTLQKLAEEATAHGDLKPPTARRYLTNDTSIEKLGELLNENPNGLLVFRDELSGFLRSFEKQNHETDRAFYLEAWNGTGSYVYDRIGRGTIPIQALCLSILGGIQPGPLASYLRTATSNAGDDGLISRFQLAVYPDQGREFRIVDRVPNLLARDRVFAVFEALDDLDVAAVGAATDGGIPFLRFSDEAQSFFYRWLEDLETTKLRVNESPAIESHLSKYRSLMPSLALLFHLVDHVYAGESAGGVSLAAAERARKWCDILEQHARRIYHHAEDGDIQPAVTLGERIKESLPNPFGARDVQRKCWKNLASIEEVQAALAILEDRGWVASVEIPSTAKGGRPTVQYHVHPDIAKGNGKAPKNLDEPTPNN